MITAINRQFFLLFWGGGADVDVLGSTANHGV